MISRHSTIFEIPLRQRVVSFISEIVYWAITRACAEIASPRGNAMCRDGDSQWAEVNVLKTARREKTLAKTNYMTSKCSNTILTAILNQFKPQDVGTFYLHVIWLFVRVLLFYRRYFEYRENHGTRLHL